MFNFSANHLFLLSRTEYSSCAVFLLQDRDTKRVYRLYDFTKARVIQPNVAYCVAGKVNSAEQVGRAVDLALKTDGVRKVISTLQVSPLKQP